MVRLTAGAPDDALLRFAGDAASQLKAARVIGISARQPLEIYASPDAYVPAELIEGDLKQIDKELKAAEKAFHVALDGRVKALEWRSTTVTFGTIADYVAQQMRAADLLITGVGNGGSMFDDSRRVDLADLVLRVGKPVLVVGSGVEKLDLRSVVLCWKDTREARRAAKDALPILKLAGRVTVVELAAKDDLDEARVRTEDVTSWLTSHGIKASACAVGAVGEDPTEIETIAKQLGACLWAYPHTRVGVGRGHQGSAPAPDRLLVGIALNWPLLCGRYPVALH
jgi:hypothetical protein